MKPTVTIGIPAYNEQENISNLLEAILKQDVSKIKITKIIISSDGSEDNTVALCQAYGDPRIQVLDNLDRRGQAFRQNQIIELAKSDVLVLLNADIYFQDPFFIAKLVREVVDSQADLVSSNMECVPARTWIGKIFTTIYNARNKVYFSYKNGLNIYTCRGAARAMSRKFYRKFCFTSAVAEDAYSYLYCLTRGFSYRTAPDAVAYIRWPEKFLDHIAQSARFFHSRQVLEKAFDHELLESAYYLPFRVKLSAIFNLFIHQPLITVAYAFIFVFSYLNALYKSPNDTWVISGSSKKLI